MELTTPIICELCEFDWKNGACNNCQMSRAQLDAVSALQQRVRELEAEVAAYKLAANGYVAFIPDGLPPILDFVKIEADLAKLSRYEQGVRVEGFLSSYPLKSTIVFAGNNDIPELRGLDDQAADILIMLKENV